MNRGGDGVIYLGVLLNGDLVFKVRLVQNSPISDFVVMSRFVIFADLVGKSTFGIPLVNANLVIGKLFSGRDPSEARPLFHLYRDEKTLPGR